MLESCHSISAALFGDIGGFIGSLDGFFYRLVVLMQRYAKTACEFSYLFKSMVFNHGA